MPEMTFHDLARLDKLVPGQAGKSRPTVYSWSPQKTENNLQLMYFIISLERGLLDEQFEENASVSNNSCVSAPRCVKEKQGFTQRSTGPPRVRTLSHLKAIPAGDTRV